MSSIVTLSSLQNYPNNDVVQNIVCPVSPTRIRSLVRGTRKRHPLTMGARARRAPARRTPLRMLPPIAPECVVACGRLVLRRCGWHHRKHGPLHESGEGPVAWRGRVRRRVQGQGPCHRRFRGDEGQSLVSVHLTVPNTTDTTDKTCGPAC